MQTDNITFAEPMKRQALILSSIYLIIMCLGYIWCYPFFKIETILFDLIFRTVLWSISSYGLYIVLLILKKFSLLKNIAISKPFLITCLPYIYLIIFLVEGFIGLVMVFVFKTYVFAYSFFSILTILHAIKLSQDLLNNYCTY